MNIEEIMNTKSKYPAGAITNVPDLLALGPCTIYHVSRKHSRGVIQPEKFTGILGARKSGCGLYFFFETKSDYGNRTQSLLDANIPENVYNDWFIFSNIEDARAYLGLCPMCGGGRACAS